MSRDRGIRLQNALAAYLRQWWPSAESAGSGRPGSDVLGTPGIVWECKTATDFKRDFKPTVWAAQAERHLGAPAEFMPHMVPVTVYFPAGIGARSAEATIAMLPLGVLVRLLREAGYGERIES